MTKLLFVELLMPSEELRFPTAVVRYFILSAVPFLYGRMQQLLRTSLDVNFKAYQKALLWFFLLAASTESSKRRTHPASVHCCCCFWAADCMQI
jgi:hypothetical protein